MMVTRRSVVVTGAGRGMGRSLSLALARAGWCVIAVGRSETPLHDLVAEADQAGAEIVPVIADVRDPEQMQHAVDVADARPGGLWGVVANAGIAGPTKVLAEVTDAEWGEVIDVNLTGVFMLCRAAVPVLESRSGGRIVVIGSVTGKRPLPGRTPYAASKLALVGLARTLALEVGSSGTTVNVVSPWLVEGDRLNSVIQLQAQSRGADEEQVRDELMSGTALGRGVTEDDVNATVEFLLSPRAGSITGQDINVSAGAVMY